MKRRAGLPKDLEDETYTALRKIYIKYVALKKSHMTKYHILGIMYDSFSKITYSRKEIRERFTDA